MMLCVSSVGNNKLGPAGAVGWPHPEHEARAFLHEELIGLVVVLEVSPSQPHGGISWPKETWHVDVVLNSSSGSPALVLSCARPCAVLRAWGFGRFSSLACSVIIKWSAD